MTSFLIKYTSVNAYNLCASLDTLNGCTCTGLHVVIIIQISVIWTSCHKLSVERTCIWIMSRVWRTCLTARIAWPLMVLLSVISHGELVAPQQT